MKNIDADRWLSKESSPTSQVLQGEIFGEMASTCYVRFEEPFLLYMNDEKKQANFWAQKELVPRFKEFIDRLLKHLKDGSLPSFFMPQLDLFQNKQDLASAERGVRDFLTMLRGNPQALI